MEGVAIASAAEIVASARLAGRALGAFDPALGISDPGLGYLVQQAANDRLEINLGARVGHKIGGTKPAMQVYLGLAEPVAGEVFASTVHPTGVRLNWHDYRRPGIETEIAVRLGQDLPAREDPFTRDEVAAAIVEVMAAIEIVDDRYEDFRTAGAPTVIADNAFNAACIVAPPLLDGSWPTLDRIEARTLIDREEVASGRSDVLLGHPLEALRWLADRRSALGLGLAAGTFVSLGSITPAQWLAGPGTAHVILAGLGEVEVTLV